jgi:DNA uptake protein ComE-like DNA-binding protein
MRKSLTFAAALTAVLAVPALTQPASAQTNQPYTSQPYTSQPYTSQPSTSQPYQRLFPTTRNAPSVQTPPASQPYVSTSPRTTRSAMAPSNQIVNINTASEKDLDSLPQIGPTRAKTIIGGRPYASTQDLLSKHVVSQRVFDKIKGRITVQ